MKIGIFGLPLSGKTTVFNALSGFKVENVSKQKAGEANRSVVKVPDVRLDKLFEYYPRSKKVNATVEYMEISGVEGKGNKQGMSESLMGNLRAVDALAHVVRVFESSSVPHVKGSTDFKRDIEDVNTELVFSDLAIVENSLDKLERQMKSGKKTELVIKKDALLKCKKALEDGKPIRNLPLSQDEKEAISAYQFLTQKPFIIILNTGEGQNAEPILAKAREMMAGSPNVFVTAICGKIEMEIAQLNPDEQAMFLQEMGIKVPALNRFISESFSLLGLIVFFTIGDDEVRAWTLAKGSTAVKAAGQIHTDLERGFIRAEVFYYDDFIAVDGSEVKLKETGKIRLEGKEYIVRDGDIITIRFNVKK